MEEAYVTCTEQRRPTTIRDTHFVFVRVPEAYFLGFHEVSILGRSVMMATPERALLDAIERPRYAGGIGETSRIVARAAAKLSWNQVLDLTQRRGSSALAQRLGYYLDLLNIDTPNHTRPALLELVRPRSKILLAPRRTWGTHGKLAQPWNVVENSPRNLLLPDNDKPRHRVEFHTAQQTS